MTRFIVIENFMYNMDSIRQFMLYDNQIRVYNEVGSYVGILDTHAKNINELPEILKKIIVEV